MSTPELRYQIRERLGRGASSEVFAAVSTGEHGFEKRVAIKRLLDDGDDAQVETFEEEARLASQLRHPSVVEVLDFGVWDGSPFQVLELVDGINLAGVLQRTPEGRMPVGLALHVIHEVATALDYVHNARNAEGTPMRIVHRDINPSNILVAWAGHVKVTDFGIARAFRRRRRTMVGTVKGTVSYMAPEQLRLEEVDARADIFALGCVLFEMVAGASPVDKTQIRMNVVAGDEVPLGDEMPKDVEAIVERATRSRRNDRYPNAAEFADDCFRVLRGRLERDGRREMAAWLEPMKRAKSAVEPMVLDVVRTARAGGTGQLTQVRTTPPIAFSDETVTRKKSEPSAEQTDKEIPMPDLEVDTDSSGPAQQVTVELDLAKTRAPVPPDTVAVIHVPTPRTATEDGFPTVIDEDVPQVEEGGSVLERSSTSQPLVRSIGRTNVSPSPSKNRSRAIAIMLVLAACVMLGAVAVRFLLVPTARPPITAPSTTWIDQEVTRLRTKIAALPESKRHELSADLDRITARAKTAYEPTQRLAIANELADLTARIAAK